MKFKYYIAIARPEHWTKNVFVLPGVVLAEYFVSAPLTSFGPSLLLTIISACLISSANYTINEWLDAPYDKHHPTKKNRPAVIGGLKPPLVWLQFFLLSALGLAIAWFVSLWVFLPGALLLIQGLLYNIEPFRTKDRIFLDVISESINNPIRLLMGWGVVTSDVFPPFSIIVGYWLFGAFLMNIKRYSELRFIGDMETAGKYRRSFKYYTEKRLLLVSIFYAMSSGFFIAVFMIKHRVEMLVSLPFIAAIYTWYLYIGMKDSSPAMNPESIPRYEKGFTSFLLFCTFLVLILLIVDIPILEWFLGPPEHFDIKQIIGLT